MKSMTVRFGRGKGNQTKRPSLTTANKRHMAGRTGASAAWLFRGAVSGLALLLLMLPLQSARAQLSVTTANLSGTVTDSSGAVVPNAAVTLKSSERGIALTAVTDGTGRYTFSQPAAVHLCPFGAGRQFCDVSAEWNRLERLAGCHPGCNLGTRFSQSAGCRHCRCIDVEHRQCQYFDRGK